MIEWHPLLYTGDSVRPREKQIRKELSEGRADPGYFVITLAANGRDLLDIVSSAFLKQRVLRERLPVIVGLAGTKQEAVRLVEEMLRDCFRGQNDLDLRSYFK